MRPIQNFAGGVLADVVRRQPASPARTTFAWQVAVGSGLARVTSVQLEGTVLRVGSPDPRWLKEIERARATILPKLQHLLGKDTISQITTR